MYKLGKIVMYDAKDICDAFHVTSVTAYRIFDMPQAKSVKIGKKKLISEDNLLSILNSRCTI
ncbi:MAG: hypothetical protein IJH12_01530 [Clostridia bacterium]|nr:hypothetical protein [Clostridia bacterium]